MKYFFVLLLIFSSATLTANILKRTPHYYKCFNKTGGRWVFGQAPKVCDLDPFINVDYVKKQFADFTFDDNKKNTIAETKRYMQKIYSLIKEVARYYLKARKPDYQEKEMTTWIRAILSVAHQETLFSHYRKVPGGKYQLVRGDKGHGHGLLQIDDRSHIKAVDDGRAAHLIFNMFYSLDEYYFSWSRAHKKKCVKDPKDYESIARSAYSAYNGGPAKICRWTDPEDFYYKHDIAFLKKFKKRLWLKSVKDQNAPSGIDLKCIIDGKKNCHHQQLTAPRSREASNILLNANASSQQVILKKERAFAIGKFIQVSQDISIRKSLLGKPLGIIKKKALLQILDYTRDEYNKIVIYTKSSFGLGYITGPGQNVFYEWAFPTKKVSQSKIIYHMNDILKGVKEQYFGLDKIAGKKAHLYTSEDEIIVKDIFITGPENSIWYESKKGDFFYGGSIFPKISTSHFFHTVLQKKSISQAPTPNNTANSLSLQQKKIPLIQLTSTTNDPKKDYYAQLQNRYNSLIIDATHLPPLKKLLESDNGHIKALALHFFKKAPATKKNLLHLINQILYFHDPELIFPLLKLFKKYEARFKKEIDQAILQTLKTGSFFVKESLAQHADLFLNKKNLSLFKQYSAHLPSKIKEAFKAHIKNFENASNFYSSFSTDQ